TALGFSEPRLAEAAARQMRALPFNHTFRGRTHPVVVALAERLLSLAPVPMARVFFAGSGSEANETALRVAWACARARGKSAAHKVIARHGAYHGSTFATAALSGAPDVGRSACPAAPWVRLVSCPDPALAREGEDGPAQSARLARELEALIESEGPDTFAAFIAEPVLGVGGVIVPPEGYFPAIQAVLRRHGIALIVDEVITGFGRTGRWWGSEALEIEPDILVCAKALSSAYMPISAVLLSEAIHESLLFDAGRSGGFGHGFTMSGHPVAAAVALEALSIYAERDLPAHAGRMGARLHDGLATMFGARAEVSAHRGLGLMAAVQLAPDFPGTAPQLAALALDEGLILRPLGRCVVMAPPLVVSAGDIDQILERLGRAFAQLTMRAIGQQGTTSFGYEITGQK
ncbi:MAG: aminotransferase class III-fold pyridoxal phosphate-dependent enzyme, partial [Rhodobacteraceae bacterium]|nr:aminotransferase class III-fold pyridoxal phosphate-dependent enzyme [Paracoccaceae bacterium]